MNGEEAMGLFYTHYTRDKDDLVLQEILRTVDFHTLTVEILAKTA
ncbi:MAG: hypothetical protein ACI8P3_003719 [Saprospiraceae bacterium]|jgi:hypothetical protein